MLHRRESGRKRMVDIRSIDSTSSRAHPGSREALPASRVYMLVILEVWFVHTKIKRVRRQLQLRIDSAPRRSHQTRRPSDFHDRQKIGRTCRVRWILDVVAHCM